MKINNLSSKTRKVLLIIFAISSFLTYGPVLSAQENEPEGIKEFRITLEITKEGIRMVSPKDSAWTEISFSLGPNKAQAVDEYGMTEMGKVSIQKDAALADYLFTVTITEDGITLIGLEGTSWAELSFALPRFRKQTFNYLGLCPEPN